MKLCDKLVNLRKKNNITQEMLADKLNVSRQAVSKWENGTSMPDMEKIMQLCKILNCSLDELVDDRATGNTIKNDTKFSINNYLKDILNFITKTYNMLCSMKWKEKIKCVLEILFLILITYLLVMTIKVFLIGLIEPLINNLPNNVYMFLKNILESIYILIGSVFSVIVIIHIFKIRYLDYFITIEDGNINEQVIENAIPENQNRVVMENNKKIVFERQKEKIIIRDPKHAGYSFINALGKLLILFIKAICLIIGGFSIIAFISIAFAFFTSAYYIKDGLVFGGFAIVLLGLLVLIFLVIDVIYRFICNLKIKKVIFTIFICSILIIALGSSITFISTLNFKYIDDINEIASKKIDTKYIEVDDKTILYFLDDAEIIIDKDLKDVQVDIISTGNNTVFLKYHNTYNKDYFYINYSNNPWKLFNDFVTMLKNKEFYDLSNYSIRIHISNENLKLLKNNLNK